MEQAINVRDLAKSLTVAPITVRREIERGNLRATRIGRRRIVILPDEVARYLKSNTGEPSHEYSSNCRSDPDRAHFHQPRGGTNWTPGATKEHHRGGRYSPQVTEASCAHSRPERRKLRQTCAQGGKVRANGR